MNSPNAARNNNNNNASLVTKWLGVLALILRILLWPVRFLSRFLFAASELDGLSPAVTAKAALQFRSYLRSIQLSLPRPPPPDTDTLSNHSTTTTTTSTSLSVADTWQAAGFAAAREQALQSQALLLVYLHSPLHWQADQVARDVLCHPALLQFVADPHVVAMGCSVHTGQGAQLLQAVQVTALPCLVVLQPSATGGAAVQLLFRAAGPAFLELVQLDQALEATTTTNTLSQSALRRTTQQQQQQQQRHSNTYTAVEQKLLPFLQTALQKHQSVLAEQMARRMLQQQESELRRQQDEEFAATLQADQERERLKLAEQQAEQERAAALLQQEYERQAARDLVRTKAKAAVRHEPAADTPNTTMIRFVVPSGAKLNRRFAATDTVGALRAFIVLQFLDEPGVMDRIGLSTSYPRTTYNDNDELTLQDAGLVPQAVLMVQDLDA